MCSENPSSVQSPTKCSTWFSRPPVQDISIASTEAAAEIKTTIETSAVTKGYVTPTSRSACKMEELKRLYAPHEVIARQQSQMAQEETEHRGSDWVLVDADTSSGNVDTKYTSGFGTPQFEDPFFGDGFDAGVSQAGSIPQIPSFGDVARSQSDYTLPEHLATQDKQISAASMSGPLTRQFTCSRILDTEVEGLGSCEVFVSLDRSWPRINPSMDHQMVCQKRLESTGFWILNEPEYVDWLHTPNSLLWLDLGKQRLRKTPVHHVPDYFTEIISSSFIINSLQERAADRGEIAVAYFYSAPNFNKMETERLPRMLCSVIAQLASKLTHFPDSIYPMIDYNPPMCPMIETSRNRQPPLPYLKKLLFSVLQAHSETFLVIDAIDEFARGSERHELLVLLEELNSRSSANVHVLATSRREHDIEITFLNLSASAFCIQTSQLDADIRSYIHHQVSSRPKLARWPLDVKNELVNSLVSGANGMFLWVSLMIDDLEQCSTHSDIRKSLMSTPKALDEVFAAMLLRIDRNRLKEAHCVLMWLLFAERDLRIDELAETLVIYPSEDLQSNFQKRLFNSYDVVDMLSSLVYVSGDISNNDYGCSRSHLGGPVVRFVHDSAKEFLTSGRCQQYESLEVFSMKAISANDFIAESCASYIMNYSRAESKTPWEDFERFPLLKYACEHWYSHTKVTLGKISKSQNNPTHALMLSGNTFWTWLRIHRPDCPSEGPVENLKSHGSPLYYASFLGLDDTTSINSLSNTKSNGQDAYNDTLRQLSSVWSHGSIVKELLERGADVNYYGGYYATPLQAAAINGNEGIVQLLLNHGADTNAQGGYYGTALQAAVVKGHESIVRLLVDYGADVNVQGGHYGNALIGSSRGGHTSIISYLIQQGASISARGHYGHSVLRRIREAGAEVLQDNTRNSSEGDSVEKVVEEGSCLPKDQYNHKDTVSHSFATALHVAAAYRHHDAIKQLLLHGFSVFAEDSKNWTSLHWAAESGMKSSIALLLKYGANIEAKDSEGRSPLSWAAGCGQVSAVQFLLEHGAEVSSNDIEGQAPLSWAAARGHSAVVSVLLNHGAPIEEKDVEGQTALSWAAWNGHEDVVNLLLEKGASVDSKDSAGRTPLLWATEDGHAAIVRILLGAGASVKVRDIRNGTTPLSMAFNHRHDSVIQLLLDAGAEADSSIPIRGGTGR